MFLYKKGIWYNEIVEMRKFDGCMATRLTSCKRGKIKDIFRNKKRKFLRQYGENDYIVLVKWEKDISELLPLDAFIRCEDGILRWDH